MTRRSAEYFQGKKTCKEVVAAGGYYVKRNKFVLLTDRTFAEQNRQRRYRPKKEYKDVLSFPINFDQPFDYKPPKDYEFAFLQSAEDIAILKPIRRPMPTFSNNPFIRAHQHLAQMELHERYTTRIAVIQTRQHSHAKHLSEYYDWLCKFGIIDFMVIGKNTLEAVPVPHQGMPEAYIRSEFKDVMNESYQKLLQLIKDAKPKE